MGRTSVPPQRGFQPAELDMSANGLETFDRSIHATNLWLKEISKDIGVDRRMA